MAITLKILNRKLKLEESIKLPKNADIILGRSDECDYSIPDEKCSGRHLQISISDDKIWAMDLNSKNGTKVDDLKIDEEQIFIGTKIEIGSTKITLNTKYMTMDEKRIFTRKKEIGGAKKESDLALNQETFTLEFTDAGVSINQEDPFNKKKKGSAKNKKNRS